MRGLAEFIMRGRWQALAVTVLSGGSLLFGWISAAAVALVTLRKGVYVGGWLLFWALLPAVVTVWVSGDSGGVLLLGGTFILATILRITGSLPLTIIATVFVGFISAGSLLLFSGDFVMQLTEVLTNIFGQFSKGLNSNTAALPLLTNLQITGILAGGNAAAAGFSLLLARYWQALLYNPGEFKREFHTLRLPRQWTITLAGFGFALWLSNVGITNWALIFVIPLSFCGFALIHAWVAASNGNKSRLIIFYLLWLMIDPIKGILILLVLVDALVDFRSRWYIHGEGS